MDVGRQGTEEPCVIVHKNPVVTEDLRELLTTCGATNIVILQDLNEAAGQGARLAIVEGDYDSVLRDPAVAGWIASGTPVLVLNDHLKQVEPKTDVHSIVQPFRSEDVTDILKKIAFF